MNTITRKAVLSVAVAAGMAWSIPSQACADTPILSSVCVLAAANMGNFNNTYVVASGQTLAINQFTALFSLIGTAYGGNGTSNFSLPDLRGRTIIGAGAGLGLPTFVVGEKGGQTSVNLTVNQLPPHSHSLAGGVVTIGTLAASTTLTGLSATASASGLTLNGSSGGTLYNSPSGNSLGTTLLSQAKSYSDTAPSVAMKAGSIGGTISISNFTGNPTTTLTGAPALSGNTGISGQGAPVSTMPPYVAMTYYIATQGIYPSRD